MDSGFDIEIMNLANNELAKRLRHAEAEVKRLRELIQEVIDHDETTGWAQSKLAAALNPGEGE